MPKYKVTWIDQYYSFTDVEAENEEAAIEWVEDNIHRFRGGAKGSGEFLEADTSSLHVEKKYAAGANE